MLQQENKNAIFLKSFTFGLIFILLASCTSSFLLRPVMAAQLNPILLPTSNIASTQTSYEIFFTTAHAGILAKVTIAFPPNSSATPRGFLVDSPILIDTRGIGVGKIKGYINGSVIYTLTSPVSVRNGTSIRLEIANITNISYPGNFHVKITTSDSSGKIIDSSSTSVRITQIETAAIAKASVGTTQLADNAVKNSNIANESITTEKIENGTMTSNDIGFGQVMPHNLAAEAVNSSNIVPGAVRLVFDPESPRIFTYKVFGSDNSDPLISPTCPRDYPIAFSRIISADGDFFILEDHPSGENPSKGILPNSWTIVVHNPNPEKVNPEHIDLGVYCANIKP
jgi:hypothetical protein